MDFHAVGVAAATTIAATHTSRYLAGHPGVGPGSGAAPTHGFEIAFYVLASIAAIGAVLTALLVESTPELPETASEIDEAALDAAA
jgi:hypothetical protein